MKERKYFLGLHIGHDRAITLADSEKIIFHTAVERLDRNKHSDSYKLPVIEIRQVLKHLDIETSHLIGVCISYLGVKASHINKTLEAEFKFNFQEFTGRFSTLDHHLAHALGAKIFSGFDEAIVLVADGAGDQRLWGSQSETLYNITNETFYVLDERVQDPPPTCSDRPGFFIPSFFRAEDHAQQISLGLKYEQITYLCGYGPGQAGQTMALAAFGDPLFDFKDMIPKDFSFSLRYSDFLREFEKMAERENKTLLEFARYRKADIASTYQTYLIEALSALVKWTVKEFSPKNLCFSGGLFLNCLSNRRLLDDNPSKNLFFFAGCNDEGQSIGSVAYAFWQEYGNLPRRSEEFPYLGRNFSNDYCKNVLDKSSLKYEILGEEELAKYLAELIEKGLIVGLMRGRSEVGPRALGNRSILADPRSKNSKTRLDKDIKRRAEFRPYAPMILESEVGKYTDYNSKAPHMLVTAQVKKEYHSLLPAITHIDGSTRVQTVTKEKQPFLHKLLENFKKISGVPILLNTSFNNELEPMIDSPMDAVRIFETTDIDVLVLENCVHLKPR